MLQKFMFLNFELCYVYLKFWLLEKQIKRQIDLLFFILRSCTTFLRLHAFELMDLDLLGHGPHILDNTFIVGLLFDSREEEIYHTSLIQKYLENNCLIYFHMYISVCEYVHHICPFICQRALLG